jgi:hypothetical protein
MLPVPCGRAYTRIAFEASPPHDRRRIQQPLRIKGESLRRPLSILLQEISVGTSATLTEATNHYGREALALPLSEDDGTVRFFASRSTYQR